MTRRHEIDYLRPAMPGDAILLHTRVMETRASRAVRATEVRRGEEVLARVRTDWVWVDPATGRPRRMPEEFAALAPPEP